MMSSFIASILNSPKEPPDIPDVDPQLSVQTSRKKQTRTGRNSSDGSETAANVDTRIIRNSEDPSGAATSRDDARNPTKRSEGNANDAGGGMSDILSAPIRAPSKRVAPDVTKVVVEKVGERVDARLEEQAEHGQAEDEQVHECCFNRFVKHRWTGNSIEILVEWDEGDSTWEPEANLHGDATEALLAYWKSQGARPINPTDPDLYGIFAIRKHSNDRKRLLVEWVGYGLKDMTWVSRRSVEETAPEMVAQYWERVKLRRRKRFTRH